MVHTSFEEVRASRLATLDDDDRERYETKKAELAVALRAGIAIRDAREAAGLSQTALANRMGVAQSALARIEAGRTNVTLATLAKIADGLGQPLVVRVGNGQVTMKPVTPTKVVPTRAKSPKPIVRGRGENTGGWIAATAKAAASKPARRTPKARSVVGTARSRRSGR